jgi:fucose permease
MELNKAKTIKLLFCTFILYGIACTIIDPLIPVLSEKLKIGYDKIGVLLLVGSIFNVLSVFISGSLCDRFNLKKIIIIGIIISLSGLALFGIYLNVIIFILFIILFRFGYGIVNSSVRAYASSLSNMKNSVLFIRLDLSWYAGAITGPLLISLMLFLNIDAKYIFLLLTIFYLILIFSFYKIKSSKNSGAFNTDSNYSTYNTVENRIENITNIISNKNNLKTENKNKINIFTVIKNPIIIIACLVLFFNLGIMIALSSWLTTYFNFLNISVSFGSIILSFFWFFSVIGLILMNKIIIRINETIILFLFVLIGTFSTVIYCFVPQIYVKIVFLMLQAIFYSGVYPLTVSMAVNENPKATGTILGISLAAAFAGPIILQPIIGFLAQYYGKEYIVYVVLVCAIVGFIFTSVLFKLLNNRNKKT